MERTPQWVAELNELGHQSEPAFLLLDFEQQQPRLWREADFLRDASLRFSFPQRPDQAQLAELPFPGDLLCGARMLSEEIYCHAFEIVKAGLQRGDSFLTNLTMPTEVELSAPLEDIYLHAAAPYRIWLRDQFVCFSPEIFIKISPEGRIASYPMKGTAPDTEEGRRLLLESPKEIAEHATIVDLIRNDLSQVAKQVRVDKYRYLDLIATPRGGLWQTSSEISGQLPPNWKGQLGTTIHKLLPAGSVSGAPKAATLQIIREAEGRPRGYYCGIALYFDGQKVDSCVLIRFIEQGTDGSPSIFWTGGGITARSQWQDEFTELCNKIRIPLRAQNTSTH